MKFSPWFDLMSPPLGLSVKGFCNYTLGLVCFVGALFCLSFASFGGLVLFLYAPCILSSFLNKRRVSHNKDNHTTI